MSDLAALRILVAADLDDAAYATWTTAEVDRAIQRALADYSHVRAQEITGTLTVATATREQSLATFTGLIRVVRVWHPYTAANPEDPPEWRRFEHWGSTLHILDGDEPAVAEVIRVYYTKPQTIKDLASATATTVPTEDEELIVLGAAGYAALEKARSAVVQAGISTDTPKHWETWGKDRIAQFNTALNAIRAGQTLKLDKRVPMHRDGWARTDTREEI
jgi:hypothetical protein